jgi:hypothetical protein
MDVAAEVRKWARVLRTRPKGVFDLLDQTADDLAIARALLLASDKPDDHAMAEWYDSLL